MDEIIGAEGCSEVRRVLEVLDVFVFFLYGK